MTHKQAALCTASELARCCDVNTLTSKGKGARGKRLVRVMRLNFIILAHIQAKLFDVLVFSLQKVDV